MATPKYRQQKYVADDIKDVVRMLSQLQLFGKLQANRVSSFGVRKQAQSIVIRTKKRQWPL